MLASFEYVFEELLDFWKDFLFIEECKFILTEGENVAKNMAVIQVMWNTFVSG